MGEAARSPSVRERYFAGYLLRKLLGRGGMAEVFLAEKIGPAGAKKEVALKRILPQYADDADRIARFLEEMKLAVTLEHRNVVHVNDFGEHEGSYYLELELVRGMDAGSLAEKLLERTKTHPGTYPGQERGLLPEPVVAWIGMQVCEGLSYAHAHPRYEGDETGVLHRDISPDNCMVDLWGEVKINDWGIAKALKGEENIVSATGHAYGKLLFAPSEQLKGQEIDARADLYALAISLFELAVGRHPYDDPLHPHEDPMSKVARAFQTARSPIAVLAPELSAGMQQILEGLIQGNRDARAPRTAAELVRPLKELAGDIHDVQKQLGRLVALVYDHGPPTITEMQGYREEGSGAPVASDGEEPAPNESAKRPIRRSSGSAATADLRRPTPRTTPLAGADRPPLQGAPDATTVSQQNTVQPQVATHTSVRAGLWLALGAGGVAVVGLLTFAIAFFAWPADERQPEHEAASAGARSEEPSAVAPSDRAALPAPSDPVPPAPVPPPTIEPPPEADQPPVGGQEQPSAQTQEPPLTSVGPVVQMPGNDLAEGAQPPPPRRTEMRREPRGPQPLTPSPTPTTTATRTRSRETEPSRGAFGL